MNFDHIDDGQFEELTYDLLVALGFKNVNWRRGTGKGGATADQGRDIVADELRSGIDGSTLIDRWFIQCKHFKAGVPPQKIHDALAWADAERPAVLLIVVSHFLSNPAKSFLDSYTANNRPAFKIRTWERKDLARLLSSQPGLIRKYGLQADDPFIDAHPAHTYYSMVPTLNTLDYFFEQVEKLSRTKRDKIFGNTYYSIIKPRSREPKHKDEVMADTLLDVVDYFHFKAKCLDLQNSVMGYFLVRGIVTDALTWLWQRSNPRLVADAVARNENAIAYFTKRLAETNDPDDIKAINGCIALTQEMIDTAGARQKEAHDLYVEFCESVIPALAFEDRQPKLPENA